MFESCLFKKIEQPLVFLWKRQPFRGDGPVQGPERRIPRNILVFMLRVSPHIAVAAAGLRGSPVPMPRLRLFPRRSVSQAGVISVGIDRFQTRAVQDVRLFTGLTESSWASS